MKNKLIESIRRILQKIVLPIQEKRTKIEEKLRLSISERITLNYLRFFILYGILFFIIVSFLFIYSEKSRYSKLGQKLVNEIENHQTVQGYEINPYSDLGISLVIYETDSKREIYNDLSFSLNQERSNFKRIYCNFKNRENRIVMKQAFAIIIDGSFFTVDCYYNLSDDLFRMFGLLRNMIIVSVIIMAFILQSGKKRCKKLLQPIKAMCNTVNRLTVNNLHSERLKVEGTKNELKDLAAVCNHMLDRLDISYDNQKQFVSNASHELRTPIAVIQGYSNLLSRWGAKDPAILEESINAIKNEASSMQDLVEKLLILSRHDKKTMKLEKRIFNMRLVVEEMIKETRMVAKNRNVEVPVLEDVKVYGDKQALKQAIRVFIDNAVKYTYDGDTIKISCSNRSGDCVITVEDTGIGMTRKDIDNIFQRFYRSDHVRDRKIEGHGLGLSIAKVIIMSHTGRIKVRTQYTKGTSFIVTIPRTKFYK